MDKITETFGQCHGRIGSFNTLLLVTRSNRLLKSKRVREVLEIYFWNQS